jgi:hypothetical protein
MKESKNCGAGGLSQPRRPRFGLFGVFGALAALGGLGGCRSGHDEPAPATGSVTLALTGTAEGVSYRLSHARFTIAQILPGGAGSVLDSDTDPNATFLTTTLSAGDYSINLETGWALERSDTSQVVEATLTSPNPTSLQILAAATTNVTYRFATSSGIVTVGSGTLVVGISVSVNDGGVRTDAGSPDTGALAAADGGIVQHMSLEGNRDRLWGNYFDDLRTIASDPGANGGGTPVSGGTPVGGGTTDGGVSVATSVCDLWSRLDSSSRAVFLTLTARLQGSVVRTDGSSMLDHIRKVYRLAGGQGADATNAGSCGGGEYNRMIMSMDTLLHASLLAANTRQGAIPYDVSDIPATSFWRDSHNPGGVHAPFDTEDETDQGAPTGRVDFFADPGSTIARSPLGRFDLATLVDPLAIEMFQSYDCSGDANPSCSYIFYGPSCFPEASAVGVDIYTASYGSFDASWKPAGCQ